MKGFRLLFNERGHSWSHMRKYATDRSLYDSLGISKEATREEIVFAYSKILNSLREHVSTKASARQQYTSACLAYEILHNSDLRYLYDLEGISSLPQRYRDLTRSLNYEMEVKENGNIRIVHCINLKLAVCGGNTEITVKTHRPCLTCHGQDDVRECLACEGSRLVLISNPEHPLGAPGTCPVCGGDGYEIKTICPRCKGKGLIEIHKRIHVSIPPGVETGTVLRLKGFGNISPHSVSAKTGDVLIALVVDKDASYRRKGNDIYSVVQVPYTMAILGGNLYVSTIRGNDLLYIPAGSQHGQEITLQGGGVKDKVGSNGNHIFEVEILLPTEISSETAILLEKLSKLNND